jgi:hypothetical protein
MVTNNRNNTRMLRAVSTFWSASRRQQSYTRETIQYTLLTLNGQNMSFVISIKYLGVIVDKKITWRLRIEIVTTKAYKTFMRLYSLFKSNRLNTNSKLALHKDLIRSIMTYACPAREFPRNTPIRVLYISFQIPYVYDYITKLCRHQAKVIQHHENIHVRHTGQGEARHRKYKRLKLGDGQASGRLSD